MAGEGFLCAGTFPDEVLEDVERAAKPVQRRHEGTRSMVVLFAGFSNEGTTSIPAWAADIFDLERPGSFSHFYDTMSFGKLQVRGEVVSRSYVSSEPAEAYLADDPTQPGDYGRFVLEILQQADPDVDFSRFDNDGPDGLANSGDDDGFVDAVFINLRLAPRNFLLGNATGVGNLGFDEDFFTQDRGVSGQPIRISPRLGVLQQARTFVEAVGSMCHEYGHVLGLPDLYDTDFLRTPNNPPEEDSGGIGNWGLMGWGALGWNGDDGPNSFCAWSRMRLGWSEVIDVVDAEEEIQLENVGAGEAIRRVMLLPTEYFLLANRQREGNFYDRNIPADGLLIWHVYLSAVEEGSSASWIVDLECADGRWKDAGYPLGAKSDSRSGEDNLDFWAHDKQYRLSRVGNLGDATDVFDGREYRDFTQQTNPSSHSQGGDLSIAVENIRFVGDKAVAEVRQDSPSIAITKVKLVDQNGDGIIIAGEEVTLAFRLLNRGGDELSGLTALLHTDDEWVRIRRGKTSFGPLPGGREMGGMDPAEYPVLCFREGFIDTHMAVVYLDITSREGLLARREFTLSGISHRPSISEVSVVDSLGNGDGLAQRGEFIRLNISLEAGQAQWLKAFEFNLRFLGDEIGGADGYRMDLDLAQPQIGTRRSPEFLLPSNLRPGTSLDFELEMRSEFGVGWDTVSVEVQPGRDQTPPRVKWMAMRNTPRGVHMVLPESQVLEGGVMQQAKAMVFDWEDSSIVATVPLHQREGYFEGYWRPVVSGLYLFKGAAEDEQGNWGESDWLAFSAVDGYEEGEIGRGIWKPIALDDPQQIPDLYRLFATPADPDVFYLRNGTNGMWRSEDGGRSWQPIGLMASRDILVDAQDPFNVYAGHAPFLEWKGSFSLASGNFPALKSVDGGHTWMPFSDGSIMPRAADPLIPGKLYGTRSGQLVVSRDGGEGWRDIGLEGIDRIVVHPADSRVVYAGGFQYSPDGKHIRSLYRSVNGGLEWKGIALDEGMESVFPEPHDPDGLYLLSGREIRYSGDGGNSWHSSLRAPEANAFMPNPAVSGQLFAWHGKPWEALGLWQSRRGTRGWKPVVDFVSMHVYGMGYFHQLDGYVWGLARDEEGMGMLKYSKDAGQTWDALPLPTGRPQTGAIFSDGRGEISISTARRNGSGELLPELWTSSDGGTSWDALRAKSGIPAYEGFTSGPDELVADPSMPGIFLIRQGGHLLRSTDDGETWDVLDMGFSAQGNSRILADPNRKGVFYLSGKGIWKSADSGTTWEGRDEGLPESMKQEGVDGLALVSRRPGRLYAGIGSGLWTTADGGMSWNDVAYLDGTIRELAVHPRRSSELYAVTSQGVWRSRTHGKSWILLLRLEEDSLSGGRVRLRFSPLDPRRIYLVTGPELLESRDAGMTWESLGKELAAVPWFNDVAADPFEANSLYVSTPWGGYKLKREMTAAAAMDEQTGASTISLEQNYPNPFNDGTTIAYEVTRKGRVKLVVYNIAGQRVKTLVDGEQGAGIYLTAWEGRNGEGRQMGSGIYLCHLSLGSQVRIRRMVFIK